MAAMKETVVLFDDGRGHLAPLTSVRAVFDVRCGALSVLERLARDPRVVIAGVVVPEALAAVVREAHPGVPVNPGVIEGRSILAINGRWAGCGVGEAGGLGPGEAGVEGGTGEIIAARVSPGELSAVIGHDLARFRGVAWGETRHRLLRWPWDVIAVRDEVLAMDLGVLASAGEVAAVPRGVTVMGAGVVTIRPSAVVAPTVVLDVSHGAIVIDEGAVIRPGSILTGPCYVGQRATILERAVIRGNTAIGPWCKVGGEVSGVIFQGYANKAHEGFLGDSWVGSWVNLGAGTTNSNLLNTYGEVSARAEPDGPRQRTGRVFLGAILGDHVKTAICTRIMTGAVVHAGVMWAASAPISGCVRPYAWVTDGGERTFRRDTFEATARAMMARRGVVLTGAMRDRLRAIHPRE